MRELLVRGKNTIDPEVIDPGGRSVEDSPVKSDFTFTFYYIILLNVVEITGSNIPHDLEVSSR
jgi:hypothetical protein